MIDKIIIAEDHESTNLSLQKVMDEWQILQTDYAFYCDDAFNKIQLAKQKGEPYDLLITDLLFETDGAVQKIANGFDLIRAVRAVQPEIRVLVFSGEDRPAIIDKLFTQYGVDAYVRKARHDVKELKSAFDALAKGDRYYPRAVAQLVKQFNSYSFTEFDINIIHLLSQGYQQNEIPGYLREHNIKPSSLSSIEKRLSQIRGEFGFSKNEQLLLFCKDAGIL